MDAKKDAVTDARPSSPWAVPPPSRRAVQAGIALRAVMLLVWIGIAIALSLQRWWAWLVFLPLLLPSAWWLSKAIRGYRLLASRGWPGGA